MIDRRKNLYCGPEHELIPTLVALANYVNGIRQECLGVNGDNYFEKMRVVGGLAQGAIVEIDKLIMIDVKEANYKKEK